MPPTFTHQLHSTRSLLQSSLDAKLATLPQVIQGPSHTREMEYYEQLKGFSSGDLLEIFYTTYGDSYSFLTDEEKEVMAFGLVCAAPAPQL